MTATPGAHRADGEASRRVLVTGAGGFLGTHLLRALPWAGYQVTALVRPGRPAPDLDAPARGAVRIVEADLRDAVLADAFRGHDLVIHAAAIARASDPRHGAEAMTENVSTTRRVIDACRDAGVPRLLHVSSTAAVGVSPDPATPADEDFAFNLAGLGLAYNETKLEAERLVLAANDGALATVVVNPGVIYGRHGARYMAGDTLSRVLHSRVVPCTAGGLSVVHVDDVVDGILRVADRGAAGERYILAAENVSFRDIARVVREETGARALVVPLPAPARLLLAAFARVRSRGAGANLALSRRFAWQYYDSRKAREQLGWMPRSFREIVRDFLAFRSARGG
jgi:dihydroflavonol-4-reductase